MLFYPIKLFPLAPIFARYNNFPITRNCAHVFPRKITLDMLPILFRIAKLSISKKLWIYSFVENVSHFIIGFFPAVGYFFVDVDFLTPLPAFCTAEGLFSLSFRRRYPRRHNFICRLLLSHSASGFFLLVKTQRQDFPFPWRFPEVPPDIRLGDLIITLNCSLTPLELIKIASLKNLTHFGWFSRFNF